MNLSPKVVRELIHFLRDLSDPEGFAFSVSEEVRIESVRILDILLKEIHGSN